MSILSPDVQSQLAAQGIELPSWAFGNSGTRFRVWTTGGTPRDPFEKIADAAEVNRVTALAPSVALHIPWDKVDDYGVLRRHAEDLGVQLGTINSNTFQDEDYKFGALTHEDDRIRRKAIDHHLECIDVMDATGSRDLKIWLAEGSNYPGQTDMRARQDRLNDSLRQVYDRLTGQQRLVLEYKFFEPSFYHTDVPDWGTSYAQVATLGDRAMVCLDTGHHAPGTNIEFIVMQLLRLGKLGSFDFNSRFYADDDLIVGAADPFQLFRIIVEVIRGGGLNNPDVAFMLDQCHNIEAKIPGQIRSVLNVQEMTARALLIDHDALAAAQSANDVLAAQAVLHGRVLHRRAPGAGRVARVARTSGRSDGRVRSIRLPGEDRGRARRRRAGRLGSVAAMTEPYSAAGGLVRVYPPMAPPGMIPNGAGLVWAHGGGFAGGDLDMPEADGVARALAARGVTVVSVDYALAPTAPAWAEGIGASARDGAHYPAASDDVITAFRWAFESELCPGPWALGGASAGANLAAGATLRLLHDVGLSPALVVLAYPTLLAVQPATRCRAPRRARRRPRGGHVRTRRRARDVRELPRTTGGRSTAAGDPRTRDRRRPRALPADAHDQRRGRRTPSLGRALRRHPRRRRARHRRAHRAGHPARPPQPSRRTRGCGIHRSHRRPARRPPSRPDRHSSVVNVRTHRRNPCTGDGRNRPRTPITEGSPS